MRIIAGKYRGLQLTSPKGRRLRPTAERVREAIFSILGGELRGMRVLDLFAGTGAMGLEALSRGAALVVLVESHAAALRLLASNVAACGHLDNVLIYRHNLRRGLKPLERLGWRFDLIFLDPPYGSGLSQRCLSQLGSAALLNSGAIVVCEHAADDNLSSAYGCLQLQKRRIYGSAGVSFYRQESA